MTTPPRTERPVDLLSKLGWPGAIVVLGLLATVVLLAWPADIDLDKIALFIGSVGAAYIAWVTALARRDQQEIKVQVNGTNDALRTELRRAYAIMAQQADQSGRLMTQMAALAPAGATLPAAITDPAHPSPLEGLMASSPVSSPPIPAANGAAPTQVLPYVP